jgi:hypothetical protein
MWTAQRATTGTSRVPDQLPILQRGRHRRPEDGACVMEYVSVLAGCAFTDHPRCTHPALATLLAPDLIGTGTRDLRTTHSVVASCLSAAAAIQPLPPAAAVVLAKSRQRIREFNRGRRGSRARLACWQVLNPAGVMVGSAFQVLIGNLRGLPRHEQNTRLRTLMYDAVIDCQRTLRGPAAEHAAREGQLSDPLP